MVISKPKWFVVWDQFSGDGDDDGGYFQMWETRWKAFNFKSNGKVRAEKALELVVDPSETKNARVVYGLTIDGRLHELKAA